MTLLAQRNTRVKYPAALLEWHRWFAWYPVATVNDGKLHWLQFVKRKWGADRYGLTMKWHYRLPRRSRSRRSPVHTDLSNFDTSHPRISRLINLWLDAIEELRRRADQNQK
jgi:hypothetical protein